MCWYRSENRIYSTVFTVRGSSIYRLQEKAIIEGFTPELEDHRAKATVNTGYAELSPQPHYWGRKLGRFLKENRCQEICNFAGRNSLHGFGPFVHWQFDPLRTFACLCARF
jgi:hypothetical protein